MTSSSYRENHTFNMKKRLPIYLLLIAMAFICSVSCVEFVNYRMTVDCVYVNESQETISIEVNGDAYCPEDCELLSFKLAPGETRILEHLDFGAKDKGKLERWHNPYYNYGASVIIGETRVDVEADHSLDTAEPEAFICDSFNYEIEKQSEAHNKLTYTFDDAVCRQILDNKN